MKVAVERGRPRIFDKELALEKALEVFWRNGYQGASLAELTEAMGINKPSLYAAFGDKSALYQQVIDLYVRQQGMKHLALLQSIPDTVEAFRAFFTSIVTMLTEPLLPGGCLVVNGTTDCGSVGMPEEAKAMLTSVAAGITEALLVRLDADKKVGNLPKDANPKILANYFSTLMTGLAVLSKSGASREAMMSVVELGLQALKPR